MTQERKSLKRRFTAAMAKVSEFLDMDDRELDAAMFRQLRGSAVAPCKCRCACQAPKP